MQKTMKAAMLAAALWTGTHLGLGDAQAQDQEEGAVELGASGTSSAEPAASQAGSTTSGTAYQGDPSENHTPASAASSGPGNLRVYLGPRLGVGGGFRNKGSDAILMARPTPGFQLGVDYVLWRYFAVGGETRFDWASLTSKNGGAKVFFWSLMVKPRARYRLDSLPLEIYLAVPGGLSVSDPSTHGLKGKASGMLGISAGASYFFGDHWAVNAELGWTWQWMRLAAQVPGNGPPQGINQRPANVTVVEKATFAQLALLAINVSYAF